MCAIISYNAYDHSSIKIVPVIASFNDDGKIKPLYIGLHGTCYKVDSYWVRNSFVNHIEFHCKIIDGPMLKPILITYYIKECIWTVPNDESGES